ncbi:MAG: histidine kinase N-terminal 7TM domain-containing protein [Anaerolineaceae bacterium]|jgi:diguanylate cyclase (GGDEF)-like protein/PAS domain S-box-containing protein
MLFHISDYSLVYLAAAVVTAVAATLAWKRRSVPGGMWLFLLILAAGEWTLADFMDVSSYGLAVKTLWGKISYFGSASIAVFLLLFALEFTHRGKWITRRRILWLMIVPALSWVVAFTNDWHHLLWSNFTYVSASANVLIYAHGPLYWVISVYIYVVALVATWFLIGFALHNRDLYRLQSIGILTATLIPYIGEIVYDFGPGVLPGLDTSAITLTISGIIFTVSLTRWKLLDVMPVAREALVEQLQDGVIVLDTADRVVDLNLAARKLLSEKERPWIGQPARQMFLPDFDLAALDVSDAPLEVMLSQDLPRFLEVRLASLFHPSGVRGGKLVILRDITRRKQAEQKLAESEQRMSSILDNISASIYVYDTQMNYLYVNRQMCDDFGQPREQIIGQNLSQFVVDDEHLATIFENDQRVLNGETIRTEETSINRRTGKLSTYWTVKLPLRDADGRIYAGCGISTDITERKAVEEKLRELSLVDELTGLNNRRGFMLLAEQQLLTAERMKQSALLLFADLDGLKRINDSLGHPEGDRALIDTAGLLKKTFRNSDILGRLGGDEFVVLAIDTSEDASETILARLQDYLNIHNLQENRPYQLSISAGVTRFDPDVPCTLDELLERGDKAMYEQKQANKRLLSNHLD